MTNSLLLEAPTSQEKLCRLSPEGTPSQSQSQATGMSFNSESMITIPRPFLLDLARFAFPSLGALEHSEEECDAGLDEARRRLLLATLPAHFWGALYRLEEDGNNTEITPDAVVEEAIKDWVRKGGWQ